MKVIINGLPYFANKIAKSLNQNDKKNKYIAIYSNGTIFDKIKYLVNLINTDLVYYMGGAIGDSNSVELALKLKKKIIMHWVGSDVLAATEMYRSKSYKNLFSDKITYYSEIPWIQEELRKIGIDSEIVKLATFDKKISVSKNLPSKFSILSYVGQYKENFYGMDKLIRLANDFPNIEINVVGISESEYNIPDNIKLLGWVEDMDVQYKNCVLYLRLIQHDGLAFSVLEALANGRYVGYTYKLEHTFHIESYEKLKELVLELENRFQENLLDINYDGMKYIEENYQEIDVVKNLINKFKEVMSKG